MRKYCFNTLSSFLYSFFFILHIYYIIFFYKIQIRDRFLLENKNFLGKIKSPVGKANRGFVADLFVAIR